MSMDEKQLVCRIEYLEDLLLRSKNQYEIDKLRVSLTKLRKQLQLLRQEEGRL